MPGRDGMGPVGNGPMTGRGLGNCTGAGVRTSYRQGYRRFGMGLGMGRRNRFNNCGYGFRQAYYNPRPLTADEQKEFLNQEKSYLEAELENINKTLNDL